MKEKEKTENSQCNRRCGAVSSFARKRGKNVSDYGNAKGRSCLKSPQKQPICRHCEGGTTEAIPDNQHLLRQPQIENVNLNHDFHKIKKIIKMKDCIMSESARKNSIANQRNHSNQTNHSSDLNN